MNRWLRTSAFVGLLGALVLGAGCAGERNPINRVQPNVYDKHFFLGADLSDAKDDPMFWWRSYVVDASASQSLIGIGSWQGVDRIVWEVTDNMLLARKAYQIADGQDQRAINDPSLPDGVDAFGHRLVRSQKGDVVAAYTITSHFDVRRSYNPSTGEELNVIEENTTDRPWNQRAFMRVDWSVNQVDNPMWEDMFVGKLFGELTMTSLAYAVTDPRNEDAPVIDEQDGYLDITNKYYVAPAQTASPFSDLTGNVPACLVIGLFTGSATYECDAQEAVVRHSYKRIDADHDFESMENTKANLDVIGNPGGLGSSYIVGIVTPGRQGFDPQYGFTDALYHRFAHRHNTWVKSHVDRACTSNLDKDGNGSADQCEAVSSHSGSQCDPFAQKCTIPYRDRTIRTVGYWVNKEVQQSVSDLLDTVDQAGQVTQRGSLEDLIDSWNQVMRVGLSWARVTECRRTGDGNRDECHAQYFDSSETDPNTKDMLSFGNWLVERPKAIGADPQYGAGYPNLPQTKGVQAVTFCHNPVREYDRHDICGATGALARVGDIRKNFIFYWPYDSRAPWGGIANWEADPLTGEILGGAAQVMGRSATYAAALNRDVLQIAMGDYNVDDLINGVIAQQYQRTLQNGRGPMDQAVSAAEQQAAIDAIDWMHLKDTVPVAPQGLTPQERQMKALKAVATSVADPTQFSTAQLEFETLANKVRGSKYEAQLVDSSWLVDALGASPSTPLDKSVLDRASPLRGLDPGRLYALRDILESRLAQRGVCFLDNHAPAVGSVLVPAMQRYWKEKFPGDKVQRGQKMYDEIWKETVKGIALHEIGHSLGMLHQFASSWDAVNYNPQYWQLRTNEGKAMAACGNSPRTGGDNDTCMGPRYNDPETSDEQGIGAESRPDLQYFGNTSTMEYQLERFGENVGLGTFDLHSMTALYGGVVETYDPTVFKSPTDRRKLAWRGYSQLVDRDLYDGNYRHYTSEARLLKVFDPARDCRPATDWEKQSGKWRIVHGMVCSPSPRDHWKWSDFAASDYMYFGGAQCTPTNTACTDAAGPYWRASKVHDGPDGQGDGATLQEYVRWHYKWGVSHNAYFHTNDSDGGADAYEVTVNTLKRFDATYPWAYFRRSGREYYYRTIASSTADRYFERMRSYHWSIALNLSRGSPTSAGSDDAFKPDVMAENEIAKFLTRVVTTPEPGGVSPSAAFTGPDQTKQIFDMDGGGTAKFDLGIVTGRYAQDKYSNDLGGSWDYLHWMEHAGFSVEKNRLIEAIVDTRPTLYTISRDNALDGRGVNINFRNDLPLFTDRIVGGILAADWQSIGQFVPSSNTSKAPDLQTLDLTKSAVTRADPQATIVFPNIGYKVQIATALYTALFSMLSGDQNLVNKMRVWIDGQVGQITIPDAEKILFTDPQTGYTFVARKYGPETLDGKTVDKGIASRMLAHANAMLGAAYQVQRDGNSQPILDSYGRPSLILDVNGQPQPGGPVSVGDLGRYVQIIDATKQIEWELGYGPGYASN